MILADAESVNSRVLPCARERIRLCSILTLTHTITAITTTTIMTTPGMVTRMGTAIRPTSAASGSPRC